MFALRLLVPDSNRREWLKRILEIDQDLLVVAGGTDIESIGQAHDTETSIIVVDLAHPRAGESRFWSAIHVVYTGARLMALAEAPIDPARLQAALHAGAYYMVQWAEPEDRIRRAARQAALGLGFIPLGNVLQAMVDYFSAGQAAVETIHIGESRVDPMRGALVRGNREIPLSVLELNLLLYLVGNAGRPVRPSELARVVWHQAAGSMHLTQQIKSAVRRLRLKLEPQPDQPRYLLNRHGHGYYVDPTVIDKRFIVPQDGEGRGDG